MFIGEYIFVLLFLVQKLSVKKQVIDIIGQIDYIDFKI